MSRDSLLFPKPNNNKSIFPLVVDYQPTIAYYIHQENHQRYLHLLHTSSDLESLFPEGSIIPSFRRTKNIKEILASKQKPKINGHSENGCFKCKAGRCDLCNN